MTPQNLAHGKIIDELIRRQCSFAIYRIPGEETPHFLMQREGAVRSIDSITALNEKRGFVIAPFRASEACPIVLIEPDIFSLDDVVLCDDAVAGTDSDDAPALHDGHSLHPHTNDYVACFDTFIRALRTKQFEKLVLSRSLTLEKKTDFSPAMAFYQACERYVHSYVYLCYTPQTGVWLGSTPEIILSGGQGEWSTVALAGTQSLQNGELPQLWDDKNREEQGYVSSYIRRQLLSLGIRPVEKGPYPAFAGALSHLKTDFCFSLADNKELGHLLNQLHPTPAVCGLPKEEAYQFILENEGYDRRYYTGFIGWIDPAGRTDLYVNLRCMHIAPDRLTLYAGGGLLASSELEDEWQETEKKLKTMLSMIHA
ncbi:isochorismate synthase [Bacteroides sp.]|uniref:isochorismate synthase n=1 Tax=Bacteroides sp. TaxID=29523 RepID=UPI002FC872BE